ncbi:MAG: substrate-binding domain-containing protein [Bifidobacteriaceae bacterium]|jgi:simple sugar transport system substrate-binding protein|nr:substrate-binding domain-containing protein [Bifidobacteriaceae bacterium]
MIESNGTTKMWRRILVGVVSIAAVGAAFGCSTGDDSKTQPTDSKAQPTGAPTDSKAPYIIAVNGPVSDAFFQPMKLGSDDAAALLGMTDYQYSASKDYSNVIPDYVALLDQAIAKNPDGLIVWNFNADSLGPGIKRAVEQGIPVVTISSGMDTWESEGVLTFIGEDKVGSGLAAGKAAAATGVKHLLCVNNAASNPGLQQRCDGAEQGMKESGGVSEQIIIPATDVNNPASATQTIQGHLSSHPDIDGVWTQNSSIAIYAADAIKNIGKTGEIKLSTLGISKGAIELLRDGTLDGIVDTQQYLWGFQAIMILDQYIRYGIHPVGAVIPGAIAIDKNNLDQTLEIVAQYPGVRGAN